MSELVKVRLLNDGMYAETFRGVSFPIDTVGEHYKMMGYIKCGGLIVVSREAISNIPGAAPSFKGDDLSFFVGTECEIINDQKTM